MTLPKPEPGLVVRYSYLWHGEAAQGRQEGVKDRPCAVVLAAKLENGRTIATVLPITHRKPTASDLSLEIPATVKKRLGLDGERSWVVYGELNRFVWPGPDLRRVPGGDNSTIAYGSLPHGFFAELQRRFFEAYRAQKLRTVRRTE